MAYVGTVKTASGPGGADRALSAGSRDIEHIGSTHTDADLELLKAVARQRMAAGQGELDLRLPGSQANGGRPVADHVHTRRAAAGALGRGYNTLGCAAAAEQDEAFEALALALARIIEPTSKLDSVRVSDEAGARGPSHATIKQRLRVYATGRRPTATSMTFEDAGRGRH